MVVVADNTSRVALIAIYSLQMEVVSDTGAERVVLGSFLMDLVAEAVTYQDRVVLLRKIEMGYSLGVLGLALLKMNSNSICSKMIRQNKKCLQSQKVGKI